MEDRGMKRLQEFLKDCKGASMVEYALLITFIALVCFVAVGSMGTSLVGKFTAVDAGFK
jgi:Flp pilus assembly pilin Flp